MKGKYLYMAGLIAIAAGTAGCITRRVEFNQAYVPNVSGIERAIPGKALVLAEPDDYDYVYTGNPKSFHGGGTKIEMPLGRIVCETAVKVMESAFSGGCEKTAKFKRGGKQAAVIKVRAVNFKYAFNQLRNLTMAITPQADLGIEIALLDEAGKPCFSKVYQSGMVNDKTTLDTLKPAETINKLTHKIAADLLTRAVEDIRANLQPRGSEEQSEPEITGSPARDEGSLRDSLRELKKLYDDGLITKEVYEQRQQKLLDSSR